MRAVLVVAAVEAESIEADFPGWRVWLSDLGHWYAVRQGPEGRWMRGTGNPVTLDAHSAVELRGLLDVAAMHAEAVMARTAAR